ncbi:glutamate synthase large subunit [Tengunoibacter tsumagoiensis]|uniref:Glutamate synthase n=1 Tax=Tengunoibacter tsumagoiensis TaxID=2014871 RepID=A0A401ZX91_9CHLR|nr:glutamate synthase large subunit [Tengunoibacter tsumagoiensis]GCE11464.1 glutamate synthase [Tengunoibacter tsumagoiensis]
MTHTHDVINPADAMYPLYDSRWEHDACGTGFLAHVSGLASHSIVQHSLEALARLTHRGAQDADAETNDGAGILTQIPHALFLAELQEQQISLPDADDLAVGMFFLPPVRSAALPQSRLVIEETLKESGLIFLGWRTPPIDYSVLGNRARELAPTIEQVLLARPTSLSPELYAKTLYHARRVIEQKLNEAQITDCYVVSLSHTTLIYKGLLAPNELAAFYRDLDDPRYESAMAIFHQRYSTNTMPAWPLAQPMRLIAHNGEINTVQGNHNWMQAREGTMASPLWGEQVSDLLPVIPPRLSSDSAQLDAALDLLTASGRSVLHSMQMLVPPAWENDESLDAAQRAWCEFHAGQIEPWDGPAALMFSDGRFVAAALDRNGLRPARYVLTKDGLLIVASETGVVTLDPENILEKGRLGPGELLAVDLERGLFLRDQEIKEELAQSQPYQEWLSRGLTRLADLPVSSEEADQGDLFARQQLFGYTHEDVEMVLRPILAENKEPTWSMGDDAPMAALSQQNRSFSDYFRQRFAQVTNPPIDPLREHIVLSLDCYLGARQSLLTETAEHAQLLHLETPLLTPAQLKTIRQSAHLRSRTLDTTFALSSGPSALEATLERLEHEAVAATEEGITLLILSDQDASLDCVAIPMVIAVGAVHRALVQRRLRSHVSLIAETSTICDTHQTALVLGYGAEAVVPVLALQSVQALAGERKLEHITRELAVERYLHVVQEGLCKIMARMGISTIRNIIGAGQFEVVGLAPEFVQRCFAGSAMVAGTVTLNEIAQRLIKHVEGLKQEQVPADTAARSKRKLVDAGRYRFRRDAEYHAYNPLIIRALQKASQTGATEDYAQYTSLVYSRPSTALRDLLTFKGRNPIALDAVESMESIRARFVVSAMSVGALSPETHKTIAAAMNSIGGRNNTGEGGEDPEWYSETLDGYPVSSKIKQVASARFGVTTEYLVRAQELEIKMAQGSKPGEGGQLPPAKVTPFIAHLRHTAPGVSLISPPPHHDIYSIEDIAQLIYDLHQVNPTARVGVKLVSTLGVGTIAAGVAKGHANYVLISGHDGGTGASPIQSIKHAGLPWERGLAEAQQVLVKNGLRQRVKVRVDGGFKTGRDVIVGAMLGAEEFGFGTAALVSLGCDMARQCHLNTCPAGIATQREDLRAKFTGRPQFLINYLTLVAEEVRQWLADLGFQSLEEIIGRGDLLESKEENSVDLRDLLVSLPVISSPEIHSSLPQSPVAERLLNEAEPALEGKSSVITQHVIHNYDRSIGASLAGEIARRYGNQGLPGVSITCNFQGSAGQSFGAFNVPGMRLILSGDANDYVGKSMTGGQIVIAPPAESTFASQENTILGNTVLYGATGGQLFAAGRAGERFAVRNSGALAVVEGVGDHCCEYMTGGMVVVLGETGRNFAAGMSAGVAYVLDLNHSFSERCNTEMVDLQRIDSHQELSALHTALVWHARKTHSKYAQDLLNQWDQISSSFWRVQPRGTTTSATDFITTSEHDDSMVSASH